MYIVNNIWLLFRINMLQNKLNKKLKKKIQESKIGTININGTL